MKKRIIFLMLMTVLLLALCCCARAENWYCPKCGRLCTDNFCPTDGTPRPQDTGSDSGTSFTIYTTQSARIRTGPASYYSLITTLRSGTALEALARVRSEEGGKDWYQIRYNGTIAYVSSVNVSESSGSSKSQPSNPGSGKTIVKQGGSDAYSNYAYIRCTTNVKIATRTGPGTTYDEPGSFLGPGSTVTVLSKGYDAPNDIWWVQVEFNAGGGKYRAYTGTKRINDLNINDVPEEIAIGSCTVSYSLECFYGPGSSYKRISRNVPAGVSCTIYGYENGGSGNDYILIEFYDKGLGCTRRAWVADPFVDNYVMYYGF